MKHVDLTGKRFGRLLVLERLPHTEKLYKYKCLCDCGNIIEAKAVNLKSGKVKSCGCLKHEFAVNRIENREDAILRREYSNLKKRDRKFSETGDVIDYETFVSIVKSPCYFCGDTGSKHIKARLWSRNGEYVCSNEVIDVNGVDSLDSSLGYIEGNCVSCCKTCNYAKNTMSIEQFKEWIERVYNYYCNNLR